MVKIKLNKKNINLLQFSAELKEQGFNKGFTIRHYSDGDEIELYDSGAEETLENHVPADQVEKSLRDQLPKPKTAEEIKQELIAEIDNLVCDKSVKDYLKKIRGL